MQRGDGGVFEVGWAALGLCCCGVGGAGGGGGVFAGGRCEAAGWRVGVDGFGCVAQRWCIQASEARAGGRQGVHCVIRAIGPLGGLVVWRFGGDVDGQEYCDPGRRYGCDQTRLRNSRTGTGGSGCPCNELVEARDFDGPTSTGCERSG